MLVTLGGQTVTCMLLLTSYFCFYFQRWRESVVSTFWDSINPKVIFGTWYQIIKGIFCCSHTFLIRSRWSFPLFLWPHCVIQGWYCEEKLDVSHSWGQMVTCMLLLTSHFCFYFQRWRESVVSTFWDSINPKVIFGTWYQIIKGIFCCSLYIFAAFVWKAVVVRLFPRVLNLNNQTIESNADKVNTTPALIYLQMKSHVAVHFHDHNSKHKKP